MLCISCHLGKTNYALPFLHRGEGCVHPIIWTEHHMFYARYQLGKTQDDLRVLPFGHYKCMFCTSFHMDRTVHDMCIVQSG